MKRMKLCWSRKRECSGGAFARPRKKIWKEVEVRTEPPPRKKSKKERRLERKLRKKLGVKK